MRAPRCAYLVGSCRLTIRQLSDGFSRFLKWGLWIASGHCQRGECREYRSGPVPGGAACAVAAEDMVCAYCDGVPGAALYGGDDGYRGHQPGSILCAAPGLIELVSRRTSRVRVALICVALATAIAVPIAAAADRPLLAWCDPIYVVAGFAGVISMRLLLVQPLRPGG